MPGDDFDQEFQTIGSPGEGGDDFDREFAALQEATGAGTLLPETEITAEAAGAPEESETDPLLSLARGMGQGIFAQVGERNANQLADLIHPRPEGAEVHGGGVLDQIPRTPRQAGYKALGNLATGIPLTYLAGPGVGAQAALGGALGASNAVDEGGGPLAAITGGGLGALLGAGGAAAAQYAPAALKALNESKNALPNAMRWLGRAMNPSMIAGELAAGAVRAAPKAAGQVMRQTAQQGAVNAGKATGFVSEVLAPKAKAQDKAYAGTPTTSWAVQSVLSSGTSGLGPQDEQRLTEAVMSGDPQQVVTTNFLLTQRNPAYAKRMQDTYEALQRGE